MCIGHHTLKVCCLLAAALLPAACGKKGPPQEPLRPVPASVTQLTARRIGGEVHLQFTLPTTNTDNRGPADLHHVEVYGFTGNPVDELGRPLDVRRLRQEAALLATLEVKPPPREGQEAPSERAPDDLPDQGSKVTVVDTLTPEAFVPIDLTKGRKKEEAAPGEPARSRPGPLVGPPTMQEPTRLYLVMGISSHRLPGGVGRVSVPLSDPPDAPPLTNACYSENQICVEWSPPARARRRVQESATGEQLSARAIFMRMLAPTLYNVYEVTRSEEGTINPVVTPVNSSPLAAPPLQVKFEKFGAERCFVVTSVDPVDTNLQVESAISAPACVMLKDVFPPAAPRGLAAVGTEGAISLIWEANTEADLGGYLVLRGEAPGEKLQPLMDAPIRDTTYRDTTVRPGVRYVYAVVAVDKAEPPNVSAPSATVEESAR